MAPDAITPSRLKDLIIRSLNLEGIAAETITDYEPLLGGGLGLDSVDALEIVVALEKEYGVKISSEELSPQVFASVATLARFASDRQP